MAGEEKKEKSSFEKRKGFWRSNWFVLLAGVAALLVLLAGVAWWWWVPGKVRSVVADLEQSMSRILGTPVTHSEVALHGIDRLVIKSFRVGEEEAPLVVLDDLVVRFDAFAFTEGLPTVVIIEGKGVHVAAVRGADGKDNFSEVIRSVLAYLERERSREGGERSRLAALLRQTPTVVLDGVDFSFVLQDGGVGSPLLELAGGTFRAENPNLSSRERTYRIDAAFSADGGKARAELKVDLDIDERSVQASADFSPYLPLRLDKNLAELRTIRYRSGEFVEVDFGKVAVANVLKDPAALKSALKQIADLSGRELPVSAAIPDLSLAKRIEGLVARAEPALAKLSYPPAKLREYAGQLEGLAQRVAAQMLADTEGDYLVLDSGRIFYLLVPGASQEPMHRLKVSIRKGTKGRLDAEVEHRRGTQDFSGEIDLVSPTGLFQVSAQGALVSGKLTGRVSLSASLEDPTVRLAGTLSYDAGKWGGTFQGQLRSEQPPLAVDASLAFGTAGITGSVKGELLIPDLLLVHELTASLRPQGWEADLDGMLLPPVGGEQLKVKATVDSALGIRRVQLAADGDVRVALDGHDLLVKKVRMGRDGVIHVEDLAVVRTGEDRNRARLRVTDLAVELTLKGKELIDRIQELDLGQPPMQLASALVGGIEVVEPVFIVTQPPRLPQPDSDEGEGEELSDKISDNLEEGSAEAVVMAASYRAAMSRLVLGTGTALEKLVDLMTKAGDRFPLNRAVVKEGKLEYSDAVSQQDRLLTDLSHFNALIEKDARAGGGPGTFRVSASFSTAVGNEKEAEARLDAKVDLSSGNLEGELAVDRLSLFAYRFLLPHWFSPSRLSFLEGGRVALQFDREAGRVALYGQGKLSDFNIVSQRLSSKAVEHLSIDVVAGEDPTTGLQFDLNSRRLETLAPVRLSFGRIANLPIDFNIDASDAEFPKFYARVSLPDMPLNDILASIPKALGSALEGLQLAGTFGFSLSIEGNSRDLRDLKFSFEAREDGVKREAPARAADFDKLSGAFKHRPPTDRNRPIIVGEGPDFVPLSQISPWLILAVTTCEDGSFFKHSGFNEFQLKMSIIRDIEKGRFARGASTLSMQLVKNLFLTHEKTVARKLQEVILTWLLEKEVRKDKLIEVYLNIIEWGEGVYGIKQACDEYFGGIPPSMLNPGHAAFLASFIPYPKPFHRRFKEGFASEERSKSWLKWWDRRLKIVKRIVRAMVNNCQRLDGKCPSDIPYCRVLAATCANNAELVKADNLKTLDDLFRPREPAALGDTGNPELEL
jgi:hypothetical protein